MLIVDALRKGNRSFPACLSICQPIGWSFLLALWCTFVIGFCLASIDNAAAAEHLPQERSVLQLRIAWGGGVPTSWRGSLSVDDGRIIDHRPLGVSEDEPGSMWIDQGMLHIGKKSSREYDGVDLDIVAPLDSHLVISLHAGDGKTHSSSMKVSLRELVHKPFNDVLGPVKLGNQIRVERTPGDKLRVQFDKSSLLFAPEESFQIELRPHLLGLKAKTKVMLKSQIVVARTDKEVSRQVVEFTVPENEQNYLPLKLQFLLPSKEGVYDLILTTVLSDDRSSRSNLFRSQEQIVAQRKVQFVVLMEKNPDPTAAPIASAPGKIVTEILPTNPWWKKVSKIPALAGFRDGPLRYGDIQLWQHPVLGAWTRLAPSPSDEQTVWVAYPLTVSQPGLPHILEVEYPTDVSQSMGVSLLEPDASGDLLPVGIDSGVVVDDPGDGEAATVATHQIVFWPKTKNPFVLITNARRDAAAVHGTIRVRGPRSVGFRGLSRSSRPGAPLPPLLGPEVSKGERLFAGYMGEPLLPENFSATEFLDEKRSLDDWVTFYEAGTRLVEYLKYGGYNALVFSVLARGGAIYPSDRLQSTPRYDTGVFASSGQDPVRKDVLELLLRLCDREGIRLIPALQLSTPLPLLEERRREQSSVKTGMVLADEKGQPWRDFDAVGGDGERVRYNPLHAGVQEEVLQIVRELVDRYGDHPSFAGLAVDLSGRGCTVFPGSAWGRDPVTHQQFLKEWERANKSNQTKETTNDPQTLDMQTAWLEWRANKLSNFHSRIADQLRTGCPQGKLFLATAGIEVSPDLSEKLRPTLPNQFTPDELLLGVGLLAKNYMRPKSGIVLLQSRVMSADFSHVDPAAAHEVGRSLQWDQPFAEMQSMGHFLQSRPRAIRLASFDAQSPFGQDATYISLAPHLVPTGSDSRELLVRDLARADLDTIMVGGLMLPLGQEESLRSIVTAYRRLPKGKFSNIPGKHDPLVLRKIATEGATYLSFANPTPWPCRVTLRVDQDRVPKMEHLSLASAPEVLSDRRIQLHLRPHDFRAIRFDQKDLDIGEVKVVLATDVGDLLKQRINELADRTSQLKNRPTIDVLENGTFEAKELDAGLVGWKSDQMDSAIIDSEQAYTGQGSLRLGNAVVRSNQFSPPVTGRLSVFVWLKMSEDFEGPLRMGIEGKHRDQTFYRYGQVPGKSDWKIFEYQINDLPLSDLSPLAIRFEHAGRGKVWIDDVVVSELYFSENERKELSRIITQAHFALTGGKYAECGRLLDGYWPRFLQRHVPLPAATVATRPRFDRQADLPRVPVEEAKAAAEEQPWWKKFPNLLR